MEGASVENYHFLIIHVVFLPLRTEQDSRVTVNVGRDCYVESNLIASDKKALYLI